MIPHLCLRFYTFLFFSTLPLICLAASAPTVEEVSLPESVRVGIDQMYGETRGEADSCGVSSVRVFKVLKNGNLKAAVGEVLQAAAREESSVEWLLRNPDEDGVYWDLRRGDDRLELSRFLFGAIDSFSGLRPLCLRLSEQLSDLLGGTEVRRVLYEEICPAPNVDGNVEVGQTLDGKYLILVISDYGA